MCGASRRRRGIQVILACAGIGQRALRGSRLLSPPGRRGGYRGDAGEASDRRELPVSDKIDLKIQYRELFAARRSAHLVELPERACLAVEGAGPPQEEQYQCAVGALHAVAYKLKFGRKKAGVGPDFVVPPLETEWWDETGARCDPLARPDTTRWRAMIMLPGFVSESDVTTATAAATALAGNGAPANPMLRSVRHDSVAGGRAAQVLYVGAYSDLRDAIRRLHQFIAAEGLTPAGRHHDTYLNDPKRTAPARLKTILRQPVA